MLECIEIRAKVERKSPKLPRFVVVPAKFIAAWALVGTTSVEAWLNGVHLGRRTLKRWDDDRWFIELTQPQCAAAHVDAGADVLLRLRLTKEESPAELVRLLEASAAARTNWQAMTDAQRRAIGDHVATAKVATTRWRRAAAALGVSVDPPSDLAVRRPRGGPPLQVVIHQAPASPESARAFSEALDLLADWMADEILCEAWKEVVEAQGMDPVTAGPPPELRLKAQVWDHYLASALKLHR